jgi:flagellar basal body-associated protein FliL
MSKTEQMSVEKTTKNSGSKKGLALLIVGIIVLIAIVVFLIFTIFVFPGKDSWYAVFLTNGRTYFGKVVKQNSQILVLHDVYYLQVQQPEVKEGEQAPQPQISLVNVKDELHGPESEMQITRDQIFYTQRLRQDSQIVSTIAQQQGK